LNKKREILFRGKAKNRENTWFEGDLRRDYKEGLTWVFPLNEYPGYDKHIVDPETVGQYTGLKDKNGVKIFEGDILRDGVGQISQVVYGVGRYWFNWLWICDAVEPVEIIGNVHDNPELLKESE